MDLVYLGLSAFGGGVVAGLLGYAKAGKTFSARKYLPTVLRALLAGGTIAVTYNFVGDVVSGAALVTAFLAGAGVDVGLHRIAGIK